MATAASRRSSSSSDDEERYFTADEIRRIPKGFADQGNDIYSQLLFRVLNRAGTGLPRYDIWETRDDFVCDISIYNLAGPHPPYWRHRVMGPSRQRVFAAASLWLLQQIYGQRPDLLDEEHRERGLPPWGWLRH